MHFLFLNWKCPDFRPDLNWTAATTSFLLFCFSKELIRYVPAGRAREERKRKFSLYLQANLMIGIIRIENLQCKYLLSKYLCLCLELCVPTKYQEPWSLITEYCKDLHITVLRSCITTLKVESTECLENGLRMRSTYIDGKCSQWK